MDIPIKTREQQMNEKDVVKVIEKLNDEIYNFLNIDYEELWWINFSLYSNGSVFGIEFLGHSIWDSDNDDRNYIESVANDFVTKEYEPLEDYLRREANRQLNLLRKIDLRHKNE